MRLLVLLKKRNVRLCVRRLPEDGTPLPKHVRVILIMNCVSGFVFCYFYQVRLLVSVLKIAKSTILLN